MTSVSSLGLFERYLSLWPKGICITLVVNWLVKPFSMAALGYYERIAALTLATALLRR